MGLVYRRHRRFSTSASALPKTWWGKLLFSLPLSAIGLGTGIIAKAVSHLILAGLRLHDWFLASLAALMVIASLWGGLLCAWAVWEIFSYKHPVIPPADPKDILGWR